MKKKDRLQKLLSAYSKVSIQCKCGHKEVIPVSEDKKLCSWCGNYVYRNKSLEFKVKLKKQMKED